MSAFEAYAVGERLRHHAGDTWQVVAVDLPGDGRWEGNILALAGDYRIRCVAGREHGGELRVHADYLHGDGWYRERPDRSDDASQVLAALDAAAIRTLQHLLIEAEAEHDRYRAALARVKVELCGTTAQGGDAESIIDAALRHSHG